jgi:hypothetical protein
MKRIKGELQRWRHALVRLGLTTFADQWLIVGTFLASVKRGQLLVRKIE